MNKLDDEVVLDFEVERDRHHLALIFHRDVNKPERRQNLRVSRTGFSTAKNLWSSGRRVAEQLFGFRDKYVSVTVLAYSEPDNYVG
ncbi:hypothetical protein RRG08_030013 [Elysia crispata]|uniref:Uncharacterized protein n=1 Tax=Elysia crispata TaxID=231223 RepID=A0AAE0XYS5_9GAST|nr:hypothetical protein RRG08_030013 [Elysia crispata]